MDKPSRRRAFLRWLAGAQPVRAMFALAALGAGYLLVGCVLLAPWVCAFSVAGYWWWRYRRPEPDITHGSARWADARKDLLPAGMLGGDTGLVVGQVYAPRPTVREAVGALFDWRRGSWEACRFFAGLVLPRVPVDVRAPQSKHWTIVWPPGSGKSTGVAIPMLLDCRDSMIVTDLKGELFAATAAHRRDTLGQKIVRLDPFGVCGPGTDTLNVLDLLSLDDPVLLDQINALADALVIRTGHERERHWDDSATDFIACAIAFATMLAKPELRSLQSVREALVDPEMREVAIRELSASEAFDGLFQRKANALRQFAGNEQMSVLTTASRHLRFLDTMCVMANTTSTSFDARELLTGKMTLYLILPPEFMRSHAALLRMWLVALIQAVVRSGGLQESKLVHVLVDEAAVLKKIDVIDDCLNRFRGYGIRLILMYQSLAQIAECWPEGKENSVLAASSQMFMQISDYQTAEHVSARAGDGTVFARSRGGSGGGSVQKSGQDPMGSYGRSWGWSDNHAPTQRRVITPAEVLTCPARMALVFIPGLPVLCTALRRFYDPPPKPPRRWAVRLIAVVLFVLVAACGARLTEKLTAPKPKPPQRAAATGEQRGKVLRGTEKLPEKNRN